MSLLISGCTALMAHTKLREKRIAVEHHLLTILVLLATLTPFLVIFIEWIR